VRQESLEKKKKKKKKRKRKAKAGWNLLSPRKAHIFIAPLKLPWLKNCDNN